MRLTVLEETIKPTCARVRQFGAACIDWVYMCMLKISECCTCTIEVATHTVGWLAVWDVRKQMNMLVATVTAMCL